jgi:YbbR domain-containing protein
LKGIPVQGIGSEQQVRLSPHAVQVTLKGPQEVMKGLSKMDVKATVDLKGLAEGTHQVPVRIQAPEGVRVLEATPPVIQVTVRPSRPG